MGETLWIVALRFAVAFLLSACSVTDTVLEPQGSCTGPGCGGPPVAVARTDLGSSSVTSLATDGEEVFYTSTEGVWSVQASGPFNQIPAAIAEGETSATGLVLVTDDSVYWVTSGPASLPYQTPSNLPNVPPGRVRKRSRDGSLAETLYEGGSPCGLAVVGSRVFWVDRGDPELGQSNGSVQSHDGAVSTLVTGEAAPSCLLADDEHLYWTRYGTKANGYTDGAIVRARQDGSELTVLATGDLKANTLVQDSSWLYFAGTTRVYRVKKDGSTGLVAISQDPDAGGANDYDFDELATDGKHVYWTNYFTGWVQRIPVTGGVSERIAEGQVTPHLTVLDDAFLYFAVSSAISRIAK